MIGRITPMSGVLSIGPGEAVVEALVCVDIETVPEAAKEAVLAAWRACGREPTDRPAGAVRGGLRA